MKCRWFTLGLVTMMVMTSAASVSAGAPDAFKGLSGTLRIAGGTAHISCETEAVKTILKAHPDVNITIAGGGSGVGIKQVCEGLVDIGNTGRAPTDDEITRCGLKVFKFAVDGIGVVVNPKNSLGNITGDQLQAVFSGRITNWKELGGSDASINVYTRDAESGTRKVFWSKGLGKGDITQKANFAASNSAMKTSVASDPNAIGYISLGVADSSVKLLSMDGVSPSPANVKSGRFKIARGLYMNTSGEPNDLSRAFISYMLGAEGQTMVEEYGFLPVK